MEFKQRTVLLTNIDCAFLNRLLYGCTVSQSVRRMAVCLFVCKSVKMYQEEQYPVETIFIVYAVRICRENLQKHSGKISALFGMSHR